MQGLVYNPANEILIAAGARPLIYAAYHTLVQPGDTIIFPMPSWNNNHYTHLSHAKKVEILVAPENNFMPVADNIKPFVKESALISLCSPLNQTGTVFKRKQLEDICTLILEENERRNEKPLYLMYDQIYWVLTFGDTGHCDPVTLIPEMRNYTVFIDDLLKSFTATGIRVGWSFGPSYVNGKMKSILSHLGAWAPKAEQAATARYITNSKQENSYLDNFKREVRQRLERFYNRFMELRSEGYRVNSIAPQAVIYLTVQFELHGMKKEDGCVLATTKDITKYILEEAHVAIVPFHAFGDSDNSSWYRLSVGTCRLDDVNKVNAVQNNWHEIKLS